MGSLICEPKLLLPVCIFPFLVVLVLLSVQETSQRVFVWFENNCQNLVSSPMGSMPPPPHTHTPSYNLSVTESSVCDPVIPFPQYLCQVVSLIVIW